MAGWVAGRRSQWQSRGDRAGIREFWGDGREGGMEGWGRCGGIYEAAQCSGTTAVLGPSTVKQARRVDNGR